MRQFEDLVKKEKKFDTETVWKSDEGKLTAELKNLCNFFQKIIIINR